RQRPGHPGAEPVGVRLGGFEVLARARFTPVQVNGRGQTVVHALHGRVLGYAEHLVDLRQYVVPPADVEEQLAERAVRLGETYHVAGVVGLLAYLLGRADGVVVAVQVAERDRVVDLQQQPQVGQRGVALGHGERAVEQRQRPV